MSYQRIKLSDLYTTDEIEDMKTYISTLSEQEKRHMSQYVYRDIVRTILEQFPDISKIFSTTELCACCFKNLDLYNSKVSHNALNIQKVH